MILQVTINQEHKVTIEVDYEPPERDTNWPGYCSVEIISADNYRFLINDLIGDILSKKIKAIFDMHLVNEISNIELDCL